MHKHYLAQAQLSDLVEQLVTSGYKVIGPVVSDGCIVFEPVQSVAQFPWGWQEETHAGSYRLAQADESRCFSWSTGPQGIKPWLFKPKQTLWLGEQTEDGLIFRQNPASAEAIAFIGLRACDLAALAIQDQHFIYGDIPDPFYRAQRKQMLLIAINCQRSAETCFCVSTGDGPEASYGYDILLDELTNGYLIQAKSQKGHDIMHQLPIQQPNDAQFSEARQQLDSAEKQQRQMPSADTLMGLLDKLNDQQWHAIAERCLACGNCTSVCPTCFCSKQESHGDLKGQQFSQERLWDSCFSEPHGYIAGKKIRGEISQRYRQWLIHKLVTWQEQFGRSGCVGCGRCISWCPVGIDLVAETNALLEESDNV